MAGLKIRRLGYALGAEITGLDFTKEIDEATIAELRRAWLEHTLLSFPNADLDPRQQMEFCSRFGALDDQRARPRFARPDLPQMSVHVNKPIVVDGKQILTLIADRWHSDRSFSDRPASSTFLLAKELPDVGGDTMFANMYAAYDALSPAFKQILDPLEGVHDVSLSGNFARESPEVRARRQELHPLIVHPLIRAHPETGRKAIFAGGFLRRIAGMTDEESMPLLDFLWEHTTRYEFLYRHRWNVNDLVMWDNRCLLHIAVQDYDHNELRRMQRCQTWNPKSGIFYSDWLENAERSAERVAVAT